MYRDLSVVLPLLLSLLGFVMADCPNECSHHGDCVLDSCICLSGYIDLSDDPIKDCSERFIDHYAVAWQVIQAFCATGFAIQTIVCTIGVIHSLQHTDLSANSEKTAIISIRKYVLGSLGFMGLINFVFHVWDPNCLYGTCVPVLNNMMNICMAYFTLGAFYCVLFHWIELYHIAAETLRQENMLMKINANYKGKQITVEDIIKQAKFLIRMKIPFIVAMALIVILANLVAISTTYFPSNALRIVFYIFNLLNWIVCMVGFLVYGRHLVKLMPNALGKRIRRLTWKLTIVIVFLCFGVVASTFPALLGSKNTSTGYIITFIIPRVCVFIMSVPLIMLYVRLSRRWPFLFANVKHTSSTQGSNSNKTVDND